jgi:hypothetical protein
MAQTTGLLPIDPAMSPQYVNRVLPIRANLLPSEITSDRNARRTRYGLLGAMLLVIVLIGAWFVYAVRSVSDAENHRDSVAGQVRDAQHRKASHQDLTSIVDQRTELTGTLGSLLADDLSWATLMDRVRGVSPKGLSASSIMGTLADDKTGGGPMGMLTVTGNAPDKRTVANYVDALTKVKGVANPFLTSASDSSDGGVTFTITAEITTDALCGQFTKSCTTGGK